MAFWEWRKFNFFDLRKNIDNGKLAEVLKDTTIELCTSGNSQIVIGDSSGSVWLITRAWTVTSFKAYELNINLAVQMKHDPCLITIGEDEVGINPVLKVWDCARLDKQGKPFCTRVCRAIPSHLRPTPATALAVHDNKNLIAIGFGDGSVTLLRGDITRQRSSKMKTLSDTGNVAISALAFKGASHLFVVSRTLVMCFNIGVSSREKGVIIDDGTAGNKPNRTAGCKPNCAVLADHNFVVAGNDAIFCYTVDGFGPCYALDGDKISIDWFRSYLIILAKDKEKLQNPDQSTPSPAMCQISILDIQNKFIVLSLPIEGVKSVVTEWGAFYIITEDKQIHHLDEKDIQSKLTVLFKKNLYDVAIKIASSQKYDADGLMDIYTQYGDHLYKHGDLKGAIEQYIKTIGRLETSYVIRKYLDSQHLEPLTYYLQELHKKGLATEDHTTLLLTCFVKLDQHDQHGKLKEFINAKDCVIDLDVDVAIKVCKQVSVDDALQLAKRYKHHEWYIRIMVEDKKDYLAALDYIADLEFCDAEYFVKKFGNILIQHLPDESTKFLQILCTNYKPKNQPLVSVPEMFGTIARSETNKARPEDYIHLFLHNSEKLVEFLEHLVKTESDLSTFVYNTLIEHHLHVWSTLDNSSVLKEECEQKVLKLLQNPEVNHDKDQTLIICQMLNFKPGILYLYEENNLYQQILRYHISQKDMDSAMKTCRKFGSQEPYLWVEMLWCPPSSQHLPEVLNVIANEKLLSPLLVIDCLATCSSYTLGDFRKYAMDLFTSEADLMTKEKELAERYRTQIETISKFLDEAATKPTTCQVSKCAACSRPLDLPARHFLCSHSYHQNCFQSFSENEIDCPACIPNNKKLLEVLKSQGASVRTTEAFHSQLGKANDGFSVVAEYFGRGVFNKITVITDDSMGSNYTSNSLSNVESSTSLSLNSSTSVKAPPVIKPDVLNYGPGAEARIRLDEGQHSRQPMVEQSKPTAPKTAILIPQSEGRMRLMEQKQNQYSSSLEANISKYRNSENIPKQSMGTTKMNTSSDYLDKDSSKNSTPKRNSPMLTRNNKSEVVNKSAQNSKASSIKSTVESLNPFEDSLNPFEESLNPFEDDNEDSKKSSKSDYDDSKNPFAEDEEETSKNDDYDKNLNPFE